MILRSGRIANVASMPDTFASRWLDPSLTLKI